MYALKSDSTGSQQNLPAIAEAEAIIELDRVNRWNVYRRLQELDLTCSCGCDRPLTVAVCTPAAALQVWSVVQSSTAAKQDLVDHLESCWQQRNPR
ncbi:MAG: Asr1405/Asl0597 family protein [Nodosilinea sp.]